MTAYWGWKGDIQTNIPLSTGLAFESSLNFPFAYFTLKGYHFNAAARPAGQHCFFHFHLFGLTENSRNLAVNP